MPLEDTNKAVSGDLDPREPVAYPRYPARPSTLKYQKPVITVEVEDVPQDEENV